MCSRSPQENRRCFPDDIRAVARWRNVDEVVITLDPKTALALADDIEFAVEYRDGVEREEFLPPVLHTKAKRK